VIEIVQTLESPRFKIISLLIKEILLEDISSERWTSLAKELPFFAEAALEIFIEAVETDLQKEKPAIMELFVEEGVMGGCTHAGLLWALESISWNLKHLAQVSLILAKLDHLDPGGTYTNRPFNSLKAIFNGLMPQTNASMTERLSILDYIVKFEPESGWKLLLALIQKSGSHFVTPIHKPYYRNWDEGWKKAVSEDFCARATSETLKPQSKLPKKCPRLIPIMTSRIS
jgi:hypothetical protein